MNWTEEDTRSLLGLPLPPAAATCSPQTHNTDQHHAAPFLFGFHHPSLRKVTNEHENTKEDGLWVERGPEAEAAEAGRRAARGADHHHPPPPSSSHPPYPALDDIYFHPSVHLPLYASKQIISSIPPIHTPFQLLRYRVQADAESSLGSTPSSSSSSSSSTSSTPSSSSSSFAPPVLVHAQVISHVASKHATAAPDHNAAPKLPSPAAPSSSGRTAPHPSPSTLYASFGPALLHDIPFDVVVYVWVAQKTPQEGGKMSSISVAIPLSPSPLLLPLPSPPGSPSAHTSILEPRDPWRTNVTCKTMRVSAGSWRLKELWMDDTAPHPLPTASDPTWRDNNTSEDAPASIRRLRRQVLVWKIPRRSHGYFKLTGSFIAHLSSHSNVTKAKKQQKDKQKKEKVQKTKSGRQENARHDQAAESPSPSRDHDTSHTPREETLHWDPTCLMMEPLVVRYEVKNATLSGFQFRHASILNPVHEEDQLDNDDDDDDDGDILDDNLDNDGDFDPDHDEENHGPQQQLPPPRRRRRHHRNHRFHNNNNNNLPNRPTPYIPVPCYQSHIVIGEHVYREGWPQEFVPPPSSSSHP